MQRMKSSSEKQRTHMDEDELVALNSWRRIDRQTREAIKRNFLPDLLEIYEVLSYLLQFNSIFQKKMILYFFLLQKAIMFRVCCWNNYNHFRYYLVFVVKMTSISCWICSFMCVSTSCVWIIHHIHTTSNCLLFILSRLKRLSEHINKIFNSCLIIVEFLISTNISLASCL